MRKLISLIFALLLALAFVACNGDGGENPEGSKDTGKVTTSEACQAAPGEILNCPA